MRAIQYSLPACGLFELKVLRPGVSVQVRCIAMHRRGMTVRWRSSAEEESAAQEAHDSLMETKREPIGTLLIPSKSNQKHIKNS